MSNYDLRSKLSEIIGFHTTTLTTSVTQTQQSEKLQK